MVRRFDEVLTQKAAKQRVEEQVKAAETRANVKISQCGDLITKLQDELAEQNHKFNQFTLVMTRQVAEQVTRQVKNEVKIISKDQVDLDKEAILRGLSVKVDRGDLEELDGKKANKKDAEDIMDAIRLLNQQM